MHCTTVAGMVSDMAGGGTVHMAAENGRHPPGLLHGLAEPRHHLRCLEVQPLRPHRHLKRRMVRENRNRFGPRIGELLISRLTRSGQKSPLLPVELNVSSAISLTG